MVDAAKPDHPTMPHRRPPMTRRQVVAQIAVAGVVLLSGIGIGTGGTILALKGRIVPRIRLSPPDPGPGPEPNFLVARWTEEYGLSEKQSAQLKEMLTRQWAATHELWQKFSQAQEKEREAFAKSMQEILTSDQYAKWENDLKRRFEHFRERRPFDPRRGGRGGPPGERGEGPPDLRMDPNSRRDGWRPGPPRDPNNPMMRGDRPRDGFRGPGSRRADWGRDRARDPNGMRDRGPRGLPPADANGPPPDMPGPQ